MTDTIILDAALGYAKRGWPVIPLHHLEGEQCSCKNTDCGNSRGKHPRNANGLTGASTDADTINRWWIKWPDANVGLLTGVVFDVLDIDAPEGGQRLGEMAVDIGLDPETCWLDGPMSITGKGSHLLYAASGHRNSSGLIKNVDWRGDGGYIVAPPSVHFSGHRYAWHPNCGPDAPLGPAPAFVLDLIVKKKGGITSTSTSRFNTPAPYTGTKWSPAGIIGTVALAGEGQRNDKVHWAAWRIGLDVYEHKATQAEGLAALEHVATVGESIGLGAREVDAAITSGYKAGLAGLAGKKVAA